MLQKLITIWKSKWNILSALWTINFNHNPKVRKEMARRLYICRNCIHFDPEGYSEKMVIPGKPGCSICGCRDILKVACKKCTCSLKELGQEPLWREM